MLPKKQKGLSESITLPAANSRRLLCFRRLPEIRWHQASSRLGSPAAVAELGSLCRLGVNYDKPFVRNYRFVFPPGLRFRLWFGKRIHSSSNDGGDSPFPSRRAKVQRDDYRGTRFQKSRRVALCEEKSCRAVFHGPHSRK